MAAANNELTERRACIEEIEALREGCNALASSIEIDQRNLTVVTIEGKEALCLVVSPVKSMDLTFARPPSIFKHTQKKTLLQPSMTWHACS